MKFQSNKSDKQNKNITCDWSCYQTLDSNWNISDWKTL